MSVDQRPYPNVVYIFLHYSKTDQFGKGCTVPLAKSSSCLCPVEALMLYLQHRGSRVGPLFIDSNYIPLTKAKLNYRLQGLIKAVGLPGTYTLHSFRVGAATTAAALGFPEYLLKAMGRWSSDAYKVYVKLPLPRLLAASKCLGQFNTLS